MLKEIPLFEQVNRCINNSSSIQGLLCGLVELRNENAELKGKIVQAMVGGKSTHVLEILSKSNNFVFLLAKNELGLQQAELMQSEVSRSGATGWKPNISNTGLRLNLTHAAWHATAPTSTLSESLQTYSNREISESLEDSWVNPLPSSVACRQGHTHTQSVAPRTHTGSNFQGQYLYKNEVQRHINEPTTSSWDDPTAQQPDDWQS